MDPLWDLLSLVVYTFGALTFSVLTVSYWSDRRGRKKPGKRTTFPLFTLVCAAAFVSNLMFQVMILRGSGALLSASVSLVRDLATGIMPALILHLVFETERPGLSRPKIWQWMLVVLYSAGLVSTLAKISGQASWADVFYRAPAVILAAASTAGLLVQAFARRPRPTGERTHRWWIRLLLLLMLACAAADLAGFGAYVSPAPDYLLLLFFCVNLYYRERLVFFDLLVKRGAFLAAGLAILVIGLTFRQSFDWLPWASALGFLLCWFLAPWAYARVAGMIDHRWLRRPYSAPEAERQFIRHIQGAATEAELRDRAAASLGAIFQAPAGVAFDAAIEEDDALAVELEGDGMRLGHIRLEARPDGIPFLSDDRHLLQSLAGALSVVLENVRFRLEQRRQEEREQQLRWLAGRAELKALRAQINPHFLFNALSVIAGLIHQQPEQADDVIEQLAHIFRYTLRKSEHEWTPLAEEVDFVSAYLRIEQARFGERLRVNFDVDAAAAHVLIPAMSIQPLIENAVRHGISPLEGGGSVGLRAAIDRESLRIEVSDNGPGFPSGFGLDDGGEGHGLRNVVERLRGYYGDAARLFWECGNGETRVVLTLPAGGNDAHPHSR